MADRVGLLHEYAVREGAADALDHLQPRPVGSPIFNLVAEIIVEAQVLEARWSNEPYARPLLLADERPYVAFEVQPWPLGRPPVH
eukprot:1586611-Prymnesium_polylepis.2